MLRWFASDAQRAHYLPLLTSADVESLWQGAQRMTEKTGGSDVGASTTRARRVPDGRWRLWADKWFCSVANAGAALTLARSEGAPPGTRGLAMFLVPRLRPDGSRNAWTLDRLKDKFGSRSMATAEVTFEGAVAEPVGDLARGFAQMRPSVLESIVHARGRSAFGRPVFELPQLRRDLLEMLLDAEAGCSVVLNAAAMLDRADAGSADDRALIRIVTPLAKYWLTAGARVVAGEAMTVRGGKGDIEEWVNARLVRDVEQRGGPRGAARNHPDRRPRSPCGLPAVAAGRGDRAASQALGRRRGRHARRPGSPHRGLVRLPAPVAPSAGRAGLGVHGA
jgi:alkylation response protein AidB-like acyl-CoA dehydrogenase